MKRKKQPSRVRAAALELLRNPRFLFNAKQRIGAGGVLGEDRNRLVLYLACLTSLLKNVVSVLVKGATSTGKNNLVRAVLSLIPLELVLTRSSFSKKALAYGSDELAGKILYLVEHRGGRDAELFRRLLQSEGELQHEATKVLGRKRGTQVVTRAGSPVILSTTTDEQVYADDETRFLSLRADESPELTRRVVRAQFGAKEEGKGEQPAEPRVWHEAFRILRENQPRFRFPGWFEYLGDRIPTENSRARRDVPRFLSLLQAVALCRSFSDGRRQEGKGQEMEIDFADYCVAFEILNEALASTYVGAHPNALRFAGAVRCLCSQTSAPITTKEVAAHLNWKESTAHKWRAKALRQKLIEYRPGTYPNNRKPLLPGSALHPTTFLPDPRLVFRGRQDVGEKVRWLDPLTGGEKVLRRRAMGEDDE
jgi:hypothetical protein